MAFGLDSGKLNNYVGSMREPDPIGWACWLIAIPATTAFFLTGNLSVSGQIALFMLAALVGLFIIASIAVWIFDIARRTFDVARDVYAIAGYALKRACKPSRSSP
jgi:hypothetical protein